MNKLRVLDLFSGIGGISLGLERAGGFETVAFCEIEDFQRKVLKKHWPEVPQYEDVTKLTGDILKRDGISVDVITGGFPCQDISVVGHLKGIKDETRSGLWSEIPRLAGELRPEIIVVENVTNLLSGPKEQRGGWFGRILGDLAAIGYDAEWHVVPAAYVGARQLRERVVIVAYPTGDRLQRGPILSTYWQGKTRDELLAGLLQSHPWPTISRARSCRDGNGLSQRVDRNKSIGNSVDPFLFELVGKAIMEALNIEGPT